MAEPSEALRSTRTPAELPLPSCCGWGQSKGRAETKGLLKLKRPGCCEDIFYLFWHLHCQEEWQSVHHSPAFSRAEGNWNLEGFSWASSQEEPEGLMVLWQTLMNREGKGCQEEAERTQRHLHYWCPQGALIRETLQHVVGASKQERMSSPKGNLVPNSHWNLWLQGSRPEFSVLGLSCKRLTATVTV